MPASQPGKIRSITLQSALGRAGNTGDRASPMAFLAAKQVMAPFTLGRAVPPNSLGMTPRPHAGANLTSAGLSRRLVAWLGRDYRPANIVRPLGAGQRRRSRFFSRNGAAVMSLLGGHCEPH
jgi:hypothetical protein